MTASLFLYQTYVVVMTKLRVLLSDICNGDEETSGFDIRHL